MRVLPSGKVEIHLFRPASRAGGGRPSRNSRFLLLRRSPHRRTLGGVWQPVTGGVERGETAWQAAAREVREETGLEPMRWWALEHLSIYYEAESDACVVLPVFAAELTRGATPRLSDEHDAWDFLTASAARGRVLWDAQRQAIDAVVREILSGRAAARAREITGLVTHRARPSRRTRAATGATRRRSTPSIARGA
jgi:dATP pyrophosphohydrolase